MAKNFGRRTLVAGAIGAPYATSRVSCSAGVSQGRWSGTEQDRRE